MKAGIITIGDEILIGQVIDSNSAWLASELSTQGIKVNRIISIADTFDDIVKTIEEEAENVDLIILTGGLGPTKDDVTKSAIAHFMNSNLSFNDSVYEKISFYFKKLGYPMTQAIKEQCFMPEGAQILDNNMGSAPGMLFKKDKVHILSLPGVPYEMKWIFTNSFLPILDTINDGKDLFKHETICTIGLGETRVEEKIRDIIDLFPPSLTIAYLPSLGHVRLRLTLKSEESQEVLYDFKDRIVSRIPQYVYGFGTATIEKTIKEMFVSKNLTLSTAESCTGGYLAHRITSVPGASAYFMGSVVAYSNQIKNEVLGVPNETLIQYGAVSEETVIAMVKGVMKLNKTDIAVAISGIAGPGGGTKQKPVGTIWLAWGSSDKIVTEKLTLGKSREKNIEYTAIAALNRLRLFLTP